MNITAMTHNTASYGTSVRTEAAEIAAVQDSQYVSESSSASNNYDSVSISKEGLSELKSLLQAAKNSNNSNVKTIEHRAISIVMSKALSAYSSSKA